MAEIHTPQTSHPRSSRVSADTHGGPNGTREVSTDTIPLVRPEFTSPFIEIGRDEWARLAGSTPMPLTEDEVEAFRGLGEPLDLAEVSEVYRPLSRLINQYAIAAREMHERTRGFLGRGGDRPSPFVIGIAGSVAVGKSTVARILRDLLARWPETPQVSLVTTDGFLYPNAELERRGISHRKGFPESYDRRGLLRFVSQVKAGIDEVRVPHYSHLLYDIVPDEYTVVRRPDILIVEGLNVLQPASMEHPLAVSDLFDFSVYVDARTSDIHQWYRNRFLRLRESAFANPSSHFSRFAGLDDDVASALADEFWNNINEPNLVENIRPTRARASLVLRKEANHRVQKVLLRKL
ncbi:type I pantothenate kinase [Leucobacter chromiireducens]|uniref:Pantothenate kinase n=1 Tax=Leucobacter chromiireducens subsp. solipictus TaxID=398235 RepID=A0ABS1SCW9_9MICO|nr:type I pantothenate kinase [Leucobacter chromiireducens]MBL3678386.1 type I pantothenate kinase [Leucobacter chromiireducens subsp. solipictus]